MMTFKQLEAIYWIARLGSFSLAAAELHTTQSAISKRVQELEGLFDVPLFDRSQRTARLTEKGEEMVELATKLLGQRDLAIQSFARPEVAQRKLRLGVTELTAMTWLPRLVSLIQQSHPRVVIEPDVDMSTDLRDKLLADEVDMIVVPDAFEDDRFVSRQVGKVKNAWMCKPGLVDTQRTVRLKDLASNRLLVQGDRSGTGIVYARWMKSIGFHPSASIVSNNLISLIGMTVSGLGVSYLPLHCLKPTIDAGRLEVIRTSPSLPEPSYVALHKRDQPSQFLASIATLAKEACDFGAVFQVAQ